MAEAVGGGGYLTESIMIPYCKVMPFFIPLKSGY